MGKRCSLSDTNAVSRLLGSPAGEKAVDRCVYKFSNTRSQQDGLRQEEAEEGAGGRA